MIKGVAESYQTIAEAIENAIVEPWTVATIEVVYYPDGSDYFGEYLSASGKSRGFEVTCDDEFDSIRTRFKEEGHAVWGQATFTLRSDGTFDMNWSYENCDENGDTVWKSEEWKLAQEERRRRLNKP